MDSIKQSGVEQVGVEWMGSAMIAGYLASALAMYLQYVSVF